VGELATLLTAIGGLLTAATGAVALGWGIARTLRRERPAAARRGAEAFGEALITAAEDGVVTPEELADALKHIRPEDDGGDRA